MKKFEIEVTRIGYGFATIEVEANSQEEAEKLALDEAGNHEFSEKDAEYVLPDATEKIKVYTVTGKGASNLINSFVYAEEGEDELDKDDIEELKNAFHVHEFNTPEEAEAFKMGMEHADGWLEVTILIDKYEIEKLQNIS